eukprot:CAMPEP_0197488594 /NCGR_PEP_ID=MMETSP1311-20131121/3530_1 /TAXON_ID=464262 /ORGANISM="Genus nov. species nov., Strain RCC856" /LENGTH=128 /DNA_ID=CAMNT_0043032689 /DNA_START=46 /DNA_END=430 /DNA_ORIENTATION=+
MPRKSTCPDPGGAGIAIWGDLARVARTVLGAIHGLAIGAVPALTSAVPALIDPLHPRLTVRVDVTGVELGAAVVSLGTCARAHPLVLIPGCAGSAIRGDLASIARTVLGAIHRLAIGAVPALTSAVPA